MVMAFAKLAADKPEDIEEVPPMDFGLSETERAQICIQFAINLDTTTLLFYFYLVVTLHLGSNRVRCVHL